MTLHHQIDTTFLFHLSQAFPGRFDVSMQRISEEFREFHCCCDIMLSHFINRLQSFQYADESSGFIDGHALISFLYTANILSGSPCCSNSNLALSYPIFNGCWMQSFIASLASSLLYFKCQTNLPCGSILYSKVSLNTNMK